MITFKEQIELFKLIGRELKKKIECFAIGGSAMMFYGAKETTKDVDLVFMEKKDFDLIKKTLYKIGFNEKKNIVKIFEHYEVAEKKPVMMEGRDTRFDLFLKEVISFKISDSILERAREIHEFENLIIKTISPEDIILLKCATEREKDREDAFELIKRFNIDWVVIIKESLHQTKIGGDVFPVFLFDFLFELKQKFKVDIPNKVLEKIRDIGEQEMVRIIKTGRHIKITKYKK
ncbi:nucleotidyltransferase [Candidatus Woesearchaeota archaeon]|nr:nucleotidyltransferase [Candidatus Woesearchaeota archaeon]